MPESFHRDVHQLFKLMLATNTTPAAWKKTLTIFIHKKGNPGVIANHRPIGLVPTIYKPCTTEISRLVTDRAETRGILSPQQEGFRLNKGTMNHLHRLHMAIKISNTTKTNIHVTYLDLVNALRSSDHRQTCATC